MIWLMAKQCCVVLVSLLLLTPCEFFALTHDTHGVWLCMLGYEQDLSTIFVPISVFMNGGDYLFACLLPSDMIDTLIQRDAWEMPVFFGTLVHLSVFMHVLLYNIFWIYHLLLIRTRLYSFPVQLSI